MSTVIDYYFSGSSPFTYLGHQALQDVARKHGAGIAFRPVHVPDLFKVSGSVPLGERTPLRQRYRDLELQRIAAYRGLPINLRPAYFPVDTTLADSCVIALLETNNDPANYMDALFRGVWVDEANMADEGEIAKRLTANGFDAETILHKAKSMDVAEIRAANTKAASEQDAVGVPSYVVNGEVFWGQDRIEYIDHALSTGRLAFSAL